MEKKGQCRFIPRAVSGTSDIGRAIRKNDDPNLNHDLGRLEKPATDRPRPCFRGRCEQPAGFFMLCGSFYAGLKLAVRIIWLRSQPVLPGNRPAPGRCACGPRTRPRSTLLRPGSGPARPALVQFRHSRAKLVQRMGFPLLAVGLSGIMRYKQSKHGSPPGIALQALLDFPLVRTGVQQDADDVDDEGGQNHSSCDH